MKKIHPFEPIYDSNSQILILGTLPSVESVKQGFYYMHPQNRFWKILSKIYSKDAYHMSIEEKKEFLLEHQIALYDVVAQCSIELSSDASIQNVRYTDIKMLIQKTSISRILLNGTKAYQLFLKAYPEYKDMAICLPSTSSANAKIQLEELTEHWKQALL
ncbi:MAG: DNA-deoxyinosine glycosylase [Anaeroplasmataceae bacterium]|nr:DNA-deoxyinosine glycosylase [Anaeroplasmataceae bacterium]